MVKRPSSWYVGKQQVWKERSDGIRQRYWVKIEDIEDDDTIDLHTVEWVLHWEYNDGTPSGLRQWEVRLQVPSDVEEEIVYIHAERILEQYIDRELITSSSFSISKAGVDRISDSVMPNTIRYKVIDNVRPQYNYPKGKWGRWKL
jgi:hypothetical protein